MRTHEDGHGWDAMTSDASGDTPDSGGSTGGSPMRLEPGAVFGDFRLVDELGEGRIGQVWEAVQISLRRSGALKLMPSGRSWTGLHPVELVSWNDCVRTLGLVVSTAPRRAEPGPRGQNAW
jgi:hypothetical protein